MQTSDEFIAGAVCIKHKQHTLKQKITQIKVSQSTLTNRSETL